MKRTMLLPTTLAVALLITTTGGAARAQDPPPPAATAEEPGTTRPARAAPAPGTVRLKWGRQAPLYYTSGGADPEAADPLSVAPLKIRKKGRSWLFRLALPRFVVLGFPEESMAMGTEQGLQLVLGGGRHVLSMTTRWGTGPDSEFMAGGGIGYAYQLELKRNMMYLELGGTLGFNSLQEARKTNYGSYGSYSESGDSAFLIAMLEPNFHIGYKYAYFTVGPRIGFGSTIAGGLALGGTFQF